jgi:hypothetical protein
LFCSSSERASRGWKIRRYALAITETMIAPW